MGLFLFGALFLGPTPTARGGVNAIDRQEAVMSVVPIIISGVLYPKAKAKGAGQLPQAIPCTLIGNAGIYGLEIGGGPIVPPEQPVIPPDQPPPTDPKPIFPIWGPPGMELPDSPGYPPVASHPLPEPQPPITPPDGDLVPGWDFGAGWSSEDGWYVAIFPEDGTLVPAPSKHAKSKKR